MKKKTKIMIVLAAACAGTLALAACNENPHTENAEKGYNVSVRWDTNGGKVESKEDTYVVDDYRYEDVIAGNGVKLFEPKDPIRGEKKKNVERSGYFCAGWYRERTLRVNEQGEPLDMYGNLCKETPVLDAYGDPMLDEEGNPRTQLLSDAGFPQGYSYGKRWDFETDRLDKEELGDFEYEEGGYALTLYAGWVPMFTYDIYGEVHEYVCESCGAVYYITAPERCTAYVKDTSKDDDSTVPCGGAIADKGVGWQVVARKTYRPDQEALSEIPVPTWYTLQDGEQVPSSKLIYGNFPDPMDSDPGPMSEEEAVKFPLTFLSVHASQADAESGTSPLGKITATGGFDLETGTATGGRSVYYALWEEGIWFHIYTAKDLADCAPVSADEGSYCYDILADIDFSKTVWPKGFSKGVYTGTFRGNSNTISHVTVEQSAASSGADREGLFGTVAAGATIRGVRFEDVTFLLAAASRNVGSLYGLFAGELSRAATIEDVSVAGKFVVGSEVYVPRDRYDPVKGEMIPAVKTYDAGLLTGNFESGGISLSELTLEAEEGRYARVKNAQTGELEISDGQFS